MAYFVLPALFLLQDYLLQISDDVYKRQLRKRADTGLLASLWEFPSVLGNLDEAGVSLALAQMGLSAKSIEPAGSAKHIFTHIEWDMKGDVYKRQQYFNWQMAFWWQLPL